MLQAFVHPKNTRDCQENLEDCTGDNEKGL